MSTEGHTSKSDEATSVAAHFAEFWSQCFEQALAQNKVIVKELQGANNLQELQKQWLAALTQALDGYLRTPVFLEMMKQNLKTITDLKMLQDQSNFAVARHFGAPLASDVTGLFERLDSAEQLIMARLSGIESRLKAIEAKLGSGAVSTTAVPHEQ